MDLVAEPHNHSPHSVVVLIFLGEHARCLTLFQELGRGLQPHKITPSLFVDPREQFKVALISIHKLCQELVLPLLPDLASGQ
jgi:hypothetical protein